MNQLSGKSFIDNLLAFWREHLKEYVLNHSLSRSEKDEIDIIEGLLNTDAPYRLWEECQAGFFLEKTINDVKKVDDAIFRLKFRIIPLSEEDRTNLTNLAISFESIVVFCLCYSLRKEGRLIEQ